MSEDGLFEVEAAGSAAPAGPDPDRPVTRGVVEDRWETQRRGEHTDRGARPSDGAPSSGVTAPLAVRMRPASLDEVVGQQHLLAPGAPLRRLVEGAAPASVLLHGPPGTGKTTLARLISQATGRAFEALSALNAGVKEVRGVIEVARRRLAAAEPRRTVLFIDEIHRFSRTQQDALLAAVEDRVVLLVGATTENPSFSVVAPLLSRSLVLGLHALDDEAVGTLLDRAVADPRGLGGAVTLQPEARAHLVRLAAGDGRRSLTALEAAADAVGGTGGRRSGAKPDLPVEITLADVERVVDEVAVRYDRAGDQHYDVISAFIKSIRGSDPDAALHYLARMIVAGEDPRFIARRLVVHASEDIGLADPTALPAAVAAAQAVQLIGLPEARINLAQVTIHLATAPKSNAVITAIDEAMADVRRGAAGPVPPHLRDGHYAGAQAQGNAVGYVYPHDDRAGVVAQQYPPDELVGRDYYRPGGRGDERDRANRLARLREVVRGVPS
ncbi:replication-associated recombination protein A [Actinomycetospora lemnae]|uniref:Replication-associated recombination protein A n=1 Tax=Actinomycetospora lemnae TaxID=3019891 RepID=A0ABT5SPQ0_9PSEU|nr:replication-associated recombination protein A [Actinomycetospora sp. DW7H6]MDD7964759.1 replication-associated recombination protein A [Actinomycetospora sp. DW7H6]